MNKKAETNGMIYGFIMIFIAVLVGLVLFEASANNIGETKQTGTATNTLVTMPANGAFTDLTGQDLLSTPTVVNRTGAESYGTSGAGNYTIYEGVSASTGVKTIVIRTDNAGTAGKLVNVSYTYGAAGYVDDSGTAAIIGIILILFAMAIVVIVLVPSARTAAMGMLGK